MNIQRVRSLEYKGVQYAKYTQIRWKGSTRPKQKYTRKTNSYTRSCSEKRII